jgi:hypothetical protein
MKETLKKLKLIESFTTELNISRSEFIERLRAITDKGDTNIFADMRDALSFCNNEFKGQIHYAGFELKMRKEMFEPNLNMAVATGTIHERDGHVWVETEIDGFHDFFIVYYVGLTAFCIIFIISMMNSDSAIGLAPSLFLLFIALLMFAIPYFLIRYDVKRLKDELERAFFYWRKR